MGLTIATIATIATTVEKITTITIATAEREAITRTTSKTRAKAVTSFKLYYNN